MVPRWRTVSILNKRNGHYFRRWRCCTILSVSLPMVSVSIYELLRNTMKSSCGVLSSWIAVPLSSIFYLSDFACAKHKLVRIIVVMVFHISILWVMFRKRFWLWILPIEIARISDFWCSAVHWENVLLDSWKRLRRSFSSNNHFALLFTWADPADEFSIWLSSVIRSN